MCKKRLYTSSTFHSYGCGMNHLLLVEGIKYSAKTWKWCMSLAQRCTCMSQLKPIHSLFITQGLHHNNYAISKLLEFCSLSESGDLSYASLLFTQIDYPNSFIYNSLIRAYSRSSQPHLALRYFRLMLNAHDNVYPDHFTFPFVLIACANAVCVPSGQQIHTLVIKNGLASSDSHIQTALIRFYSECKMLKDARNMFDEIPDPDVVKCNILMTGCLQSGLSSDALAIYQEMLLKGNEPDAFCVTTALTACAHSGAILQGKQIHEYIKQRTNLSSDAFLGTALVEMYSKCGSIDMAVQVFDNMPKRSVCSWSVIIGGFAHHGHARKAIECLEKMQVIDGLRPDGVVLLGVLTACNHAGLVIEGQSLIEKMEVKYGVRPKHEHYSCMVDMLCRAGLLDEALRLIRRMPMKPLASVWGALLSGCRTLGNIKMAEIAAKELICLENGNGVMQEDIAYVQLSNIYLAAGKSENASKIRKLMGEKGHKKTRGCSVIEIDGQMNEFVSADVSHPDRSNIHSILQLLYHCIIPQPNKSQGAIN
ncbi:putative pentatricopeptide repeat-containing protein At3g28640 [Impatiens glandulifera]|uniref:putative pentatricopeptide repeat-containing protein At3g28640 n=1 Tax=Impatiens glandulifera TaxID=253017 RepID=UPI001FB0EA06|nr:putative pentatricopeptide repeat-containing protein At3g28640 [Impatiens glandulifera]